MFLELEFLRPIHCIMKTFILISLAVVLLGALMQQTAALEEGDIASFDKEWSETTDDFSVANGCDCSGLSCKCCIGFSVFKACATTEVSGNSIKLALKFLGSTVASVSFSKNDNDYETCGKKSGFKVCLSLVDVIKASTSFSAKAKIKVKGIGSKKSNRFTINY